MTPLYDHLTRIETKIDAVGEKVTALDKDLAVHKAKTSRFALVLGSFGSLVVALVTKGCM
jgi:hypothetical protein